MRKKIILLLTLSAMLLTACNKDVQTVQTEQSVTSAADVSEITEIAETEQTEKETVPEKLPKFYEDIPENMRLFRFAKLNSEDEYTAVNTPAVSNDIKVFVNGNIICSFCKLTNSNGTASARVIRFYDIDSGTVAATIPMPEKYRYFEFIGGGGDVLCKASFTEYKEDENGAYQEDSVITVKNDYSYEFSEYTPQNAALPIGGHNIAEWYLDIIDADRDMTLMEGSEGDNSDGTLFSGYRYHVYMFPIDENRFVYLTGGHEYTSCFGIYDFRTDICTDIQDTEDMRPIGIHDGKIYSVLKPWDKTASDIYVTDIDTLETVKLAEPPRVLGDRTEIYYLMPESGERIFYMYHSNSSIPCGVIGMIDPDTGKILKECDVPHVDEFYSQLYLKDENTAVIISYHMDKALIIDMTE